MRSQKRFLTALVGLALGVMLMVPALGQAQIIKKVDNFEILADLSGSMNDSWQASDCGKMRKFNAQKELLQKVNAAIPHLNYQAALRRFGFKFYISGPEDWSRLEYGPTAYSQYEMGSVIDNLDETQGITPLGPAIAASDEEFSIWCGTKALVIFSDFHRDPDFGDPVAEAKKLMEKYCGALKIYTIGFCYDGAEIAMAKEIAAVGCGMYFDGCTVLKDQCAFDAMMAEIFYIVGCVDTDQDGVCDDVDECPNTPIGAVVDERGCWIGAYESFFDFNKAVVKKKYYPNIQAAAEVLKKHPELNVVLEGHTDSIGSQKYNYNLGLRRAKAVRAVLVKFGVDGRRLNVKSYGKLRPIASNDTPEGRAKNRRVEISVMEMGQ